ncbi:MAG: carboxymuconolactone decarboxylase family protein [Legionella sp.]|jgi:alkyl hydroperoxide reductase subunit D
MNIEQLQQSIPDFAKDIRLNVSNLFGNIAQSGLTESQFFGTALAVAYSLNDKQLIEALKQTGEFSDEVQQAAKTAATLMAMTNVYYRAIHLAENKELASMPANLRMNAIVNPGVPKIDFELYSLAVSAISGCGMCISTHVAQILKHDVDKMGVQTVLRLAATLNAVSLVGRI